jgi:23S rRNA pseudouridine1911/1915/1917 synthase
MTHPKVLHLVHSGEPARLDRIIVATVEPEHGFSRSQVERWIESGCVSVAGKVVKRPGVRVDAGAAITCTMPEPEPTHLSGYDFALDVLFEDEHLLVLNKPAGISMHPGAGDRTKTLANAVVAHVGRGQSQVGDPERPGIVHRLDKNTTGVVVIAKTTPVHSILAKQFAARTISRTYTALVYTTPRAIRAVQKAESGEIDAPIGRHPTDRKKMSILEDGKRALTRWKVVDRFAYGTLLQCSLGTGRTHQIRVHMDSIGSPIIGDPTYGDFTSLPRLLKEGSIAFGRQALHAATLAFDHPIERKRVEFCAPMPTDMSELVALFKGVVSVAEPLEE